VRPSNPVNGQLRYNTDTSRFEIYYNAWQQVAINGNVTITKDTFVGDGSTTTFALSKTPPGPIGTMVFVGNVHQNPAVAYTISSNNIIFATIPPSGQNIDVLHNFYSTDAN